MAVQTNDKISFHWNEKFTILFYIKKVETNLLNFIFLSSLHIFLGEEVINKLEIKSTDFFFLITKHFYNSILLVYRILSLKPHMRLKVWTRISFK